jgi:DNA uptake protein ComE-like DNA-binding protein
VKGILLLLCIHCASIVIAQQTTEQLEQQASAAEEETEDDSYWQNMEQFRKHPVDINTADEETLKELGVLNALQVENFMVYRDLLGKLVSIYELQAVPGWDVSLIRRLLPFIRLSPAIAITEQLKQRFHGGDQLLLIRISQGLEKSADADKYAGSRQKILLRYRYQFKQLLQFGFTADKDAGESLISKQHYGFDFYSFHLFARKLGIIQSIAVGDFTVNMGQGLIQWQGLAFGKSSEVMAIKRQSPVLRPYSSAGEFYFFRGAGITIRKGGSEATVFASVRKLSAAIDTIDGHPFISSFQTAGYHRTATEIAAKNNSGQTCAGFNVAYNGKKWKTGINTIYYQFSLPAKQKEEPYNLYAISGQRWVNASIDYEYTWRSLHFFGEAAIDRRFSKAFINGVLLSVDPRVDLSLLYRNIAKEYRAVNGNAFTEGPQPSNERGCYAGITIRPAMGWKLNAYADLFQFPWLRYRIDAPADGVDYSVQLIYTPNKKTELHARFHYQRKPLNKNNGAVNSVEEIPQQRWRMHLNYQLSAALTIRERIEMVWYDRNQSTNERGWMLYTDFNYKPLVKPFSVTLRLQFFETTGYNSRIYAYENDVLYAGSVPSFSGKGFSYYVVCNYNIDKQFSIAMRLRQLINYMSTTNGIDDKKTEFKLQGVYFF